jgi:Golgi nucleoside diphosphatase
MRAENTRYKYQLMDQSQVPLLEYASQHVPVDAPLAPVYILATGGMRSLSVHDQEIVFDGIWAGLLTHDNNSHLAFRRDQLSVITGEDEGVNSWLALNFRLGCLVAGAVTSTVGILEMGGSTVQVAIEVAPSENAAVAQAFPQGLLLERNPVDCNAATHSLLVFSLPNFGGNQARERYLRHLVKEGQHTDPCLLQGQSETLPNSVVVNGTGQLDLCESTIQDKLLATGDLALLAAARPFIAGWSRLLSVIHSHSCYVHCLMQSYAPDRQRDGSLRLRRI